MVINSGLNVFDWNSCWLYRILVVMITEEVYLILVTSQTSDGRQENNDILLLSKWGLACASQVLPSMAPRQPRRPW